MLKKNAKQTSKKPKAGCYSLDYKELDWMHCREQFTKYLTDRDKGFFFSHEPNNGKCVADFILRTEDILIRAALNNLEKSKFFVTNLNFVLWIEPSNFWRKCPMKISLFTMLLRCGLNYKGNYEEALYSTEHSKRTKKAIQRFLYGFTESSFDKSAFVGIGKGWVNCFNDKNIETICERLTCPDYLDKNEFLFGEEILWT